MMVRLRNEQAWREIPRLAQEDLDAHVLDHSASARNPWNGAGTLEGMRNTTPQLPIRQTAQVSQRLGHFIFPR